MIVDFLVLSRSSLVFVNRKHGIGEAVGQRQVEHVRNHPLAGDVIALVERCEDDDDADCAEVMIRVIAAQEDRVWFKEYGLGHTVWTVKKWQNRIDSAVRKQLIRSADHDAPF